MPLSHDQPEFLPRMALVLVNAVHQLHRLGYVHRDLKGDNVMVEPSTGHVVLLDYGSACRAGRPLGAHGVVSGTIWYQPPEMLARQGIARTPDTAED